MFNHVYRCYKPPWLVYDSQFLALWHCPPASASRQRPPAALHSCGAHGGWRRARSLPWWAPPPCWWRQRHPPIAFTMTPRCCIAKKSPVPDSPDPWDSRINHSSFDTFEWKINWPIHHGSMCSSCVRHPSARCLQPQLHVRLCISPWMLDVAGVLCWICSAEKALRISFLKFRSANECLWQTMSWWNNKPSINP